MSEIATNLARVGERIELACQRAGRSRDSVELIAVSKTFPVELIREASDAGQLLFGESKLQEAEVKIAQLPTSLRWHFIGRVQRNKVRKLLLGFEVIHAIDSLRLACHTNETARELGLFPQVFLQVNIGEEISKGGFRPETLRIELEELLKLDRLEIVGLMCIPPAGADPESARPWFSMLRQLRNSLEMEFHVRLPGLSMGMSGDFEIAIDEGATHVRVGSSIFGKRAYRVDGELG